MNPLRALGLYDFPAWFYHKHWSTIGKVVSDFALKVLNQNLPISSVNYTYITLIPKVKSAKTVGDFRPISLYNVIYKIIAKALAIRLKQILPSIISSTQSAFILGHLITDNVLVAYKILHSLTTRSQGFNRYMAIKLDMSKAYDRVEWGFLNAIMVQLGFSPQWIKLIMECITTVTYSILINGEPQPDFKPYRGIRKGDLLSPNFFIICVEALSSMLYRAERIGNISGVPIGASHVKINHLFFADDNLLFCKTNSIRWCNLLHLLSQYKSASGHLLGKNFTIFQ